jgi:hypothetical protein
MEFISWVLEWINNDLFFFDEFEESFLEKRIINLKLIVDIFFILVNYFAFIQKNI